MSEGLISIGGRAKAVRLHFGKSQQEVSDLLGLSVSAWQKMERDEGVPSGETLLLFNAIGINPGWVLTGMGEMLAGSANTSSVSQTIDSQLIRKLASLAREVRKEIGSEPHGDTIMIDAIGLYNNLLFLVSNIEDMEEVEANWSKLRFDFKRKLQEQSGNLEEGRNIA